VIPVAPMRPALAGHHSPPHLQAPARTPERASAAQRQSGGQPPPLPAQARNLPATPREMTCYPMDLVYRPRTARPSHLCRGVPARQVSHLVMGQAFRLMAGSGSRVWEERELGAVPWEAAERQYRIPRRRHSPDRPADWQVAPDRMVTEMQGLVRGHIALPDWTPDQQSGSKWLAVGLQELCSRRRTCRPRASDPFFQALAPVDPERVLPANPLAFWVDPTAAPHL
jgi:hypothetical protein